MNAQQSVAVIDETAAALATIPGGADLNTVNQVFMVREFKASSMTADVWSRQTLPEAWIHVDLYLHSYVSQRLMEA